jgi:hypothetical protein
LDALALMDSVERRSVSTLTTLALKNGDTSEFSHTECGVQYGHIFSKRLRTDDARRTASWRAADTEARPDMESDRNTSTRYRERFLESAELIYTSSRTLASAYAAKILPLVSGLFAHYKGVMVSFALQGDEAKKPMRVPDESKHCTMLALTDGTVGNEADGTRKEAASIVVQAKVQYSELRVSFLLQHIRSKAYLYTTFDLPCTLQHYDRVTSNNMTSSQEDLLTLPGYNASFFEHFAHVGVLPTQDASGGNEKQVNCAGVLDRKPTKYGGKCRFRVALICAIHAWARSITSQFHVFRQWVSGAIAFAIVQKEPNKLGALRKIVGERLRSICQIVRTSPPA